MSKTTEAALRAAKALLKRGPLIVDERDIQRMAETIDQETTLPNLLAAAERVVAAMDGHSLELAEAEAALRRAIDKAKKGVQ